MSHTDTHHSFSVELAIKYGMEKAVLIHHFQHWIKFNRRKKSAHHCRDGHWWMYQKRSDISAVLPYLTMPSIRHHCDELVQLGVLKKGNYNKLRIDTTIWYAFVNEAEFLGPEDSNNPYERGKPQSTDENLNPIDENLTPVPDPNSDPKTTDLKAPKKRPTSSASPSGIFKDSFEGKIAITEENYQRLLLKYDADTIKHWSEKLYRYSFKNPSAFKKYRRHDMVIEDWIEDSMAKGSKPLHHTAQTENTLNDKQKENWEKNLALVNEVKLENPQEASGLYFFYKFHVLKDKNNREFDLLGTIDHRDFCRVLGKHLGLAIEEALFV